MTSTNWSQDNVNDASQIDEWVELLGEMNQVMERHNTLHYPTLDLPPSGSLPPSGMPSTNPSSAQSPVPQTSTSAVVREQVEVLPGPNPEPTFLLTADNLAAMNALDNDIHFEPLPPAISDEDMTISEYSDHGVRYHTTIDDALNTQTPANDAQPDVAHAAHYLAKARARLIPKLNKEMRRLRSKLELSKSDEVALARFMEAKRHIEERSVPGVAADGRSRSRK